ncbi:MAG TPA: hypothetical protein P5246_00610 [Candidatus Omnitrophota bacterium]|nr:hypothetical protein [Candidatus Omnitrophota bacterium]HSA30216.1 hypothetical protein [Candidatus Omnitrophota bacterium]
MKKRSFFKTRWLSAQSAAELAVFGAVVMFVIASLIKVGLSMSQRTNNQLRAFRLALLESYRTSEGRYGDIIAARNSASIMILEDRLTVEPGSKQGTSNRLPFLAQGSGTFSKNMLYPKDMGEKSNFPFYDVFINGQRFPLIMADFIYLNISVAGQVRIQRRREGQAFGSSDLNPVVLPPCNTVTPRACWNTGGGFAVFMRKNYNYPANEHWCSGTGGGSCPNLPAKWRFDLDLDGDLTDVGNGYVPENYTLDAANSVELRDEFMWQWIAVAAYPVPEEGTPPTVSVTFRDEAGSPFTVNGVLALQVGERADVDSDFQDETVHTLSYAGAAAGVLLPTSFLVMDSQEGEIDFSWDNRSDEQLKDLVAWWTAHCTTVPLPAGCSATQPVKPEVGLQKDVRMYSFTKDGTYLRLEEGKLVIPSTNQVVRSTTKRDHVDIIERIFLLSNDTDRFCDESGSRRVWGGSTWAYNNGVFGLPNPVEACNNCFSAENVQNTCFDESSKILYIRSRLDDVRGRKWQTIYK